MKKTISVKKFISELGENFSEHMKERLLDLELRTVLTRKDEDYRLDMKHVEHTKYICDSKDNSTSSEKKKEYDYGQFMVIDGDLYFSESCLESDTVMESPVVNEIFNSLNSAGMIVDCDVRAKLVSDNNIDYLVDTLLEACPPVSQRYLDIVKEMTDRSNR